MATATPSRPTLAQLAESQRRVRHPLESLRKYIRFYVSMEGVAVLLLYLALWFWIGLALDYGFFKLFGVDWVQELPWSFRAGALVVLLAGLLAVVAVKVLVRLLTEFRDDALALVLERRFPQLFGDRLITAVELADTSKTARYGYSPEMIEQTIVEAGERVDQAPVSEVFNWKRLTRQGVLLGVLIVGTYLVVGAGACILDSSFGGRGGLAGFGRFHEVAGIWFERNVLLRDTLWPRRAFLELVGFPSSGEMRIGQDAPPPTIRARALKWVIADPEAPERWRALKWSDLSRPDLLGETVPLLPGGWLAQRQDWSVDQVELQLAKVDYDKLAALKKVLEELDKATNSPEANVRKDPRAGEWVYSDHPGQGNWRPLTWKDVTKVAAQWQAPGETLTDLPSGWFPARTDPAVDQIEAKLASTELETLTHLKTEALDELERINDTGRLQRTVRKLVIPENVYAYSRGSSSYNTITMLKTGENEYAGTFSDLKESIRFTVRGEDYYTSYRNIVVVPPPGITKLTRDEFQPAYLFYRVPGDSTAADLKTRKQVFRNLVSSVSGGDTTRIQVPFGTDLVLTATVDKALRHENKAEGVPSGARILPPRKGVAEVKANVEQVDDNTFRTRFDNVRTTLDFVFEFTDTDNVTGLRHIIIKPQEDTPPDVNAQVEVVRKTSQGYLVSPFALVPFSGKVIDDHGLSEVNYVCTLTRLDTAAETGSKAILLLGAIYQMGGGVGRDLAAALQLAALAKESKAEPESEDKGPEKVPITGFVENLQARADREVMPQQNLLKFLALPGDKPFEVEVDDPSKPGAKKMVQLPHPISQRTLLGEYTLDPEKPASGFDMLKLQRGPRVAGEKEVQTRYRMQVWVEATDNDILTGPHRSLSKEKFTFQVVSVRELLSEIAKEEENLHVKLDDMVNRLKESRSKLDQVIGDLGSPALKADQFAYMSVRAEEIEQVREKSETATQEVWTDYQRIIKEMELNRVQRVQAKIIEKVQQTIANPLDDILHADFPRTREAIEELRKALDSKDLELTPKGDLARKSAAEARNRLDLLIQRMTAVLNAMEGLTTINKLIKQLQVMEEEERAQFEVLDAVKREIEKKLFDEIFGDEKPKDEKPKDKK
jgi:hypothetical protein